MTDPLIERIDERLEWWKTREIDPVWRRTMVMDIEHIRALILEDRERIIKGLDEQSGYEYENHNPQGAQMLEWAITVIKGESTQ